MNYYEILKVPPTASFEEIKKAYILLSKMMHPDKFDAKTQKDQWEKANELLKELNAAFSTLKDPALRRQYDLLISSGNSQQRNSSKTRSTNPPPTGGLVKTGEAYIENFPDEIIARLKKLGNKQYPNSMTLYIAGCSHYKWTIGISALVLMIPLWHVYSDKWEGSMMMLGLLTAAVCSSLIAISILKIKEYNKRITNSGAFLTNLHLIEISGNFCRYFWRRDMKDIKVVHKHRNGQYTGTDVDFIFDLGTVSVHYSEKSSIENIAQFLKQSDAYVDKLIEEESWSQLLSDNIFHGAETLTSQHLKFKPPTAGRISFWKKTGPIIAGVVAFIYISNHYLSDVYAWNVANNNHSIRSYKLYLSESKLRFFENQAQDSCWSVAKTDENISSLRDYMSGNLTMKYSGEARLLMKQRYQAIKDAYLSHNSKSNNQRFVLAVGDWLDRAMETGETTVKVVFTSENDIPNNLEDKIRKQTDLRNILPINDAFSEANNSRRNAQVFEKFKASFAGAIPEDALSLQMADTSEVKHSDIFIGYVVSPGQDLYFREEDSATAEIDRPFYPGVLYSWTCLVIGNDRTRPFVLEFASKPAEHFRLTNRGVYNDMANSAFEDLESELTRLIENDFNDNPVKGKIIL